MAKVVLSRLGRVPAERLDCDAPRESSNRSYGTAFERFAAMPPFPDEFFSAGEIRDAAARPPTQK
eukprot:CAMPEP_0201606948 /NCGR_PEP_ID=MMETSP0492-20130828/6240_1 /ASSEMBLY_ACC=CAM_ASM_000837 /TAXON_ID=420259 /ORGANISM="Thalassiosira gravida, Strain GMp14c1" /LENGTH=64 /DNA_ID=CAMNT_0048071465 /DNA_START=659 /DNA_END=853 /DNA_ORIENTATION=-